MKCFYFVACSVLGSHVDGHKIQFWSSNIFIAFSCKYIVNYCCYCRHYNYDLNYYIFLLFCSWKNILSTDLTVYAGFVCHNLKISHRHHISNCLFMNSILYRSVNMFTIYVRTNFICLVSAATRSLRISIQPKTKCTFESAVILLFYSLQEKCLNRSYVFFEDTVTCKYIISGSSIKCPRWCS